MSWKSILADIGLGVAAPFTGGASLSFIPAADSILSAIDSGGLPDTLTGAAKGGLDAQQKQDALKLALANAKTNRLQTASALPATRLKTSAAAGMTSRATPTKINWGGPGSGLRGEIPTTTGGFHDTVTPTADTKQLADQVQHDELLSQLQGGPSAPGGGTDMEMPTVGDESTSDKVLGGAGLGTSILSSIMNSKPGSATQGVAYQVNGPNEPPLNGDDEWWKNLPGMGTQLQ